MAVRTGLKWLQLWTFAWAMVTLVQMDRRSPGVKDIIGKGITDTEDDKLMERLFECVNGEYILRMFLCDGTNDCSDKTDERNCSLHFPKEVGTDQCDRGRFRCDIDCISYWAYCNNRMDCGRSYKDEESCRSPNCNEIPGMVHLPSERNESDIYKISEEWYHCPTVHSGFSCIPKSAFNQTKPYCLDFVDKIAKPRGPPTGKKAKYGDCKYLIVDNRRKHECFDSDTQGAQWCPSQGTDRCGFGDDHCVPETLYCDGVPHCDKKNDEDYCGGGGDTEFKCAEQYKCRGTRHTTSRRCIDLEKMCDGNVDCAAGEDEFGCHLKCPKGCDCVNSLSYYCMNASYSTIPEEVDNGARYLDLSFNQIANFSEVKMRLLHNLKELNLSHNLIEHIPHRPLWNFTNLYSLDLSHNLIVDIKFTLMSGLRRLLYINLLGNPLQLSSSVAFAHIDGYKMQHYLKIDINVSYTMCCAIRTLVRQEPSCPVNQTLMSCDVMIPNIVSETVVRMICIFTILFNFILMLAELARKSHDTFRFFVLFTKAIAGLFGGFYLTLVVVAESYLLPFFLEYRSWQYGSTCMFAMFMANYYTLLNYASLLGLIAHQFIVVNIEKIRTEPVFQSIGFVCTMIFVMFILPLILAMIPVCIDRTSADFMSIRDDMGVLCHPYYALVHPPTGSSVIWSYAAGLYMTGFIVCAIAMIGCYAWGCYVHVTLLSKTPLSDDARQLNWEFAVKGGIVSKNLIFIIIFNVAFHMAEVIMGLGTSMGTLGPFEAWERVILAGGFVPFLTVFNGVFLLVDTLCDPPDTGVMPVPFTVRRPSKIRRSKLLKRSPSKKYLKLNKYLEEGNKLTPREMFHACNRMIDLITDFHEEGLVCDYIDNGYLILGLDEKNYIKEIELVANTEVPKFDVHEWRKQRDMEMFGQTMMGLIPHCVAQKFRPVQVKRRPPPETDLETLAELGINVTTEYDENGEPIDYIPEVPEIEKDRPDVIPPYE